MLSGCATTKSVPFPVASNDLSNLTWKTCYSEFQCATLKVPIDYSNLSIGTFDIAVLRYRNPNQHDRIGSLVVNPGGPGVSGIEFALESEFILNPEILERYDIVGFDPRGIGQSSAIHCLSDSEQDAVFATDPKPDNDAEYAQAVTDSQNYVDKCVANTKNLRHFSTAESAHDMELLRQSLGDPKLNFMGFSYGTYLGTLYAQQFPEKVGRFVLDGAINPSIPIEQQTLLQAVAFDKALANFINDCHRHKDCPLPSGTTAGFFTELFNRVAAKPLSISGSHTKRLITEGLVVTGTAAALYDDVSGWPALRTSISQALENDGTGFAQLADGYNGRRSDGTYLDNQNDANIIIDCLDWHNNQNNDAIRSAANKFSAVAPVFGPYLAFSGITCNLLDQLIGNTQVSTDQNTVQIKTATPILIIGTTQDPATPYEWAKALNLIILGSRLLTLQGEGHTGYGRGSVCTDNAVDTYLTTGRIPSQNLICAQ